MLATIEFFESRGKAVLKQHDHEHTWYGPTSSSSSSASGSLRRC